MPLIPCPDCSREISLTAPSCPHCGRAFSPSREFNRPPKSRAAAVAFALLLGGVGAHKFYLEKPGVGVVYILFCWTFIPAILGLIEGLLYLAMSDVEFIARYSGMGKEAPELPWFVPSRSAKILLSLVGLFAIALAIGAIASKRTPH